MAFLPHRKQSERKEEIVIGLRNKFGNPFDVGAPSYRRRQAAFERIADKILAIEYDSRDKDSVHMMRQKVTSILSSFSTSLRSHSKPQTATVA
jgi:hypothetical protein